MPLRTRRAGEGDGWRRSRCTAGAGAAVGLEVRVPPRPRRLEGRVAPWPGCEGRLLPPAAGANGAVAPDPPRGCSHQQLRLKSLSRREKLGFMASTLGGRWTVRPPRRRPRREAVWAGGPASRGGAHRWSAPPPGSPEGPGLPARATPALGPGPTPRYPGNRPPAAPHPHRLPANPERRSAAKQALPGGEGRARRPCRGNTREGSGGLPAGPRHAGLRRSSPFLFAEAPAPTARAPSPASRPAHQQQAQS